MKPHKHAELIKAWADGKVIEHRCLTEPFLEHWHEFDGYWGGEDWEYRIKPKQKPDVERYCQVGEHSINGGWFLEITTTHEKPDNLKLTFDGETGELKSAEVLK